MVFGSLSTVDRFRTAEAEALSRYNTVRSIAIPGPARVLEAVSGDEPIIQFSAHGLAGRSDAIETSIYLPGGRKIRAADILRTDLTHQPLIFLASCETASPEPNLPDQTFGFAAAFASPVPQQSVRRCSPSRGSRQFWWQRGFTTK